MMLNWVGTDDLPGAWLIVTLNLQSQVCEESLSLTVYFVLTMYGYSLTKKKRLLVSLLQINVQVFEPSSVDTVTVVGQETLVPEMKTKIFWPIINQTHSDFG